MPQVEERNPSLWWLDFELPKHTYETVISMIRVDNYWLLTTNRTIYKFSVDPDGNPVVKVVQELYGWD